MFPDILHESSNVAWFSVIFTVPHDAHVSVTGLVLLSHLLISLSSLFSPTSVCPSHFPFSTVLWAAFRSLFFHPYLPTFLMPTFPVSSSCLHKLQTSFSYFSPACSYPSLTSSIFLLLLHQEKIKQNPAFNLASITACLVSLRPWGFQLRLVLSSIPAPMSETQFSLVHVLMHPCPHPQALTVTCGTPSAHQVSPHPTLPTQS